MKHVFNISRIQCLEDTEKKSVDFLMKRFIKPTCALERPVNDAITDIEDQISKLTKVQDALKAVLRRLKPIKPQNGSMYTHPVKQLITPRINHERFLNFPSNNELKEISIFYFIL